MRLHDYRLARKQRDPGGRAKAVRAILQLQPVPEPSAPPPARADWVWSCFRAPPPPPSPLPAMSLLAVCLLMHVACLEKQPELAERLQRFAAGLPPHAWGNPAAEVLLPGAAEAWEVVGAVAGTTREERVNDKLRFLEAARRDLRADRQQVRRGKEGRGGIRNGYFG